MRLTGTSGLARKLRRTLPGRGQRGFVLIELLVSIAIFGVISVGFLSALVAGYHGVIVAHDQTTAESLTRTALENIGRTPFADISTTSDNVTVTSKFRVEIHADYIDAEDVDTMTYEDQDDPSAVKMITVTVKYDESGRTILVTRNTKVMG